MFGKLIKSVFAILIAAVVLVAFIASMGTDVLRTNSFERRRRNQTRRSRNLKAHRSVEKWVAEEMSS